MVLGAVAWPGGPAPTASATSNATSSIGGDQLRPDWFMEVMELAENAEKTLAAAELEIRNGLDERKSKVDRAKIRAYLDETLELIHQLFDPGQSPTLDETDLPIDASIDPDDLEDYAEACVKLAEDAVNEVLSAGADFDQAFVGSSIRTIEYLIIRSEPHGYKSLASFAN